MNRKELIEELRELSGIPGVSGYEEDIRNWIFERIIKFGEPRIDNIGNLILEIGEGKHLVMVAHMDEIGFVATKIEDDGSLRFRKMGGIDDTLLLGRHVNVYTKKGIVEGVIGTVPPHLKVSKGVKVTPWHETKIDVGTFSKRESEDLGIKVLSPITFKKEFSILNENILAGRGIDDRFGCLALMKVLERVSKDLKVKISFAFSVQEEIGLRGAKVLASTLKPDFVIAVDSFACCSNLTGDVRLGNGPVLRILDNSAFANPRFSEFLKGVSEKRKIPLQIGVTGGGTDASVFQEYGGIMTPVTIPIKYLHSPVECCHIEDFENLINLLLGIVEDLEGW
ncbi:MAG: M42 family metallopeptidase [Candidatus Methanofastidiosia archaeon]